MKRYILLIILLFSLSYAWGQEKTDTGGVKAPPLPCVTPTTQANNFTATATSSSTIDLSWSRGDGDYVIILAHEGSAVDADPVSGTTYTANSTFGSGSQIGTGNYVVYIGSNVSTTVSGLNPSTQYYFEIYEFYDSGKCYLTPGATTNATTSAASPVISNVTPDNFFSDKGKQITITGSYLTGATVTLGGVTGTIVSNDGSTLIVDFPPEYYTNNTLTVSTGTAPDATATVTVNTRNVIPVGGGTDYHTTIQSALDGLYAWYKTTSFDAGQLPGAKTIDVYNGTYTEDVTPNSNLVPTAADNLIIQNHTGETPVVDATSLTNAFSIDLNYVEIKGFTAYGSTDAVVSVSKDNCFIHLNQLYGSTSGSGILLNNASNCTLQNNLIYNNYNFGIRITNSNNTVVKNNTVANDGHSSKAPPLPGVYDPAELYVESGTGTNVTNNIFYAKTGTYYFTLKTEDGITVSSDYNTYYKNGNKYLVYYNNNLYSDITSWSGNGAGTNDIDLDPDFVNPGTDFHIHSVYGSYAGGYWPPDIAAGGSWTLDATTSPALDAGNPSDPYSNEPASGNIINQGAYGNTAQASKSSLDFYWTGNVNTDWQNTGNWSTSTIPTSSDNAIIPDGCPNYPVIDDGTTTAVCNNLTIEANSSVTIDTNGQMTVFGTVTNNRGVDGLIIKSGAGDGSLIMNTANVPATVERFLPTAGTSEWHFLSPAITSESTTSYGSYLYAYDETQDDWWTGATYYYNAPSGWTSPPATMTPANGYIFFNGQTTLLWQGNLNANSQYTVTAPYTVHSGNAPNGQPYTTFDGWLLAGNPYPCSLDWEAVNISDNINNTVYYYDDNIDNYAYYQVGGTSLNGGTRYIPLGQGFFVKTDNTSGGGNLVIPASARVHANPHFWKNPVNIPNIIKLKISSGNYYDETAIRINKNASLAYDKHIDAYKQFSWKDEVPQIFSYNPKNGVMLAINNVSLNGFRTTIPLGFKQFENNQNLITIEKIDLGDVWTILHNVANDRYSLVKEGDSLKIIGNPKMNLNQLELILEKNVPPEQILRIPNQKVMANSYFSFSIPQNTFIDKNIFDNISYSIEAVDTALPEWLKFDKKTLTFSGKAPKNTNINLKINAIDKMGASVSAIFNLSTYTTLDLQKNNLNIKIYPVPASDYLEVYLPMNINSAQIVIQSITGQKLIEKKTNEHNSTIELSNIQNGVYVVKIITAQGSIIRKITVQR